MNKKKKLLVVLDIIGIILCVIGVLVLTFIFKIVNNDMRYLFLLGDVVIFVLFSSCINSLEMDLKDNVKRYSLGNVNGKYLKSVDNLELN